MKLQLYWVQTADHLEDWFMVAQDMHEAARLHEEFEGYESPYAEAEEIMAIPEELEAEPGWPSEELLLALGARYKRNDGIRVVEIDGRTYCEGMLENTLRTLDDDLFEARGDDRINGTERIHEKEQ